eukprot:COSAG03_NODE_3207_length_2145_cov_2.276149_1_plen_82_part_00
MLSSCVVELSYDLYTDPYTGALLCKGDLPQSLGPVQLSLSSKPCGHALANACNVLVHSFRLSVPLAHSDPLGIVPYMFLPA